MRRTLSILFLAICISLCGCGQSSYLEEESAETADFTEEDRKEQADSDTIYVQIEGAVKDPGVYELPADSRVFSLIEAAGGLTEEASTADLNQAQLLSDGVKLTVLTQKEQKEQQAIYASGGGSAKVNINTADAGTLTTISGIGEAKAQAIIAYREQNGPFAKTEDITKVSGIGDATFARVKDKITV